MTRVQLRQIIQSAAAPSQFPVASRGDPVNLESLRRYTLGNAEVEREVLQLFCEHAPIMFSRLSAAATEKDWRDSAHALKGSALALGAWRIADLATQAEATDGFAHRGDLLGRIEGAIDEVQDFIAAADWPR
jgi:HPt (histidine-containing phosphotransfer) domain-containing protein